MPHSTPAVALASGPPDQQRMLDAAVLVALGTVEQLAALGLGVRPVEVGIKQSRQAERAVDELRRRGLVETADLDPGDDPLPARFSRELYRPGRTPQREDRMQLGIYATMALDAVRAAPGVDGLDGAALRRVLVILEPDDLERMLDDLVTQGLLRRTRTGPADRHVVVWATDAGREHWAHRRRALRGEPIAPPQPPASRYRLHHVLTLEAALELMAEGRGRFVGFWADREVRARLIAGRPVAQKGLRSVAPMSTGPVPDGEVRWRTPTGELRTARIEILTSSYSERQIVGKKGLPDVRIFTASPAAADRARRLGFRGVHLLDGRPLGLGGLP